MAGYLLDRSCMYVYISMYIIDTHVYTATHANTYVYTETHMCIHIHTLLLVYILTENTRSSISKCVEKKTLITDGKSSNQSKLLHQFSESRSPQGGGEWEMAPAHAVGSIKEKIPQVRELWFSGCWWPAHPPLWDGEREISLYSGMEASLLGERKETMLSWNGFGEGDTLIFVYWSGNKSAF